METTALHPLVLVVISLPALWLLFKKGITQGKISENMFVLLAAGYTWIALLTLSRAIWTTTGFKVISFIIFLLFWYPTIRIFRRIYRKKLFRQHPDVCCQRGDDESLIVIPCDVDRHEHVLPCRGGDENKWYTLLHAQRSLGFSQCRNRFSRQYRG